MRRTGPTEVRHYGEMFEYLDHGALLRAPLPKTFARAWLAAKADSFVAATPEHAY